MTAATTTAPPAAPTGKDRARRLRRERRAALLRALGDALFGAVVTIVVVLLGWQLLLAVVDVSSFTAKGPADVWNFLFVDQPGADADDTAAAHRAALLPLVGQTAIDALIGFAAGMTIAIVLALLFTLSKTVEAGVMPFALFLRSVPLVAIAPALLLITGRGTVSSVAVIGSIVVLFPALASVLFGLSRANPDSIDLVHVYGGSDWASLLKVAVPGALPSIFAAARVSVPGAVTGAMLAEWLSTGKGVGGAIPRFTSSIQYDELWSAIALITFGTLIVYNLVQLLENAVLARMGMTTTQ
ncbi:ABC transporter permease subunit [Nocardioides sp. GY 10113]|uniref:ABC transporter permease n=1 Tax=Nocardioides sp. GY 10113 TaxID=2569761 RepID=UPI0010A7E225|nr:ABC transporter permease subunit [Nocardioides sp. GY 10113]TIC86308.1 ABC transporter permease subunit [Nocardioides sp. GY 10113]